MKTSQTFICLRPCLQAGGNISAGHMSAAEENSFPCTSHVSRHSAWLLGIAGFLLVCRACGWGGTAPAPTGLGAVHEKDKKAISNLRSFSSSIFVLLASLLLNFYTVMPP